MGKIAKPSETALTISDTPAGFENFDASDTVMPSYRIVQGTSKDAVAPIGTFENQLTGSGVDSVRVVGITYKRSRVAFAVKDNGQPDYSAAALCRSDNGLVPSPFQEDPRNNVCMEKDSTGRLQPVCDWAKWDKDSKGNAVKPPCKGSLEAIFYDVNESAPFTMRFGGTAIKPFKRYLSALWSKRCDLFAESALMSLTKVDGDNGVYYVPSFGQFEPVEDIEAMAALHASLTGAVPF